MEAAGALKDILHSTISVSCELEALQKEHQLLLSDLKSSEDFSSESKPQCENNADLETILRDEKIKTVDQTLNTLKKGMEEAQLMIMLANYMASLESDKLKLKAQVKRLCAENNWLRKSLTDSQRLLQEAEIALAKIAVDKEHLEFMQNHGGVRFGEVDLNPDMEVEGGDTSNENEVMDASMVSHHQDYSNSLDISLDYEIPEKIRTLQQLALQYVHQGKPDVAIPLCRKAIQELEQKTGRNNPDLAVLLNILAVIYREQGRFKEAIRVLRETLEIRENVFGMKHPSVAATLNNLSVLHGKCGDYKIAEPFCQRALEIRLELLGPEHPDVAKQFCNLAILCSHLGRYDEVEHYYQRALEIFKLELGQEDPSVTKTMNNLANCYLKQGKYKAAEAMYKKVLKTVHQEEKSAQGLSHKGEAADSAFEGSPSQNYDTGHWHKMSPLESPTVNDMLRSLTDTYRGQGRMDDAAELELLTKEKKLDGDRISRIFEDTNSPQKLERNYSAISTKQQNVQQQKSRSSVSWGWVFGQRPELNESSPQFTKHIHSKKHHRKRSK